MLKVLDKYITDEAATGSFYSRLDNRDRKLVKLFALSVIGHLIFYGAIVRLDLLKRFASPRPQQPRSELVMITEVAPAAPALPLRNPPRAERLDPSRMQYDPKTADDVNLLSRAPKVGAPNTAASKAPPAKLIAVKPLPVNAATATSSEPTSPKPPSLAPIVAQPVPIPAPGAPSDGIKIQATIPAPPAPTPNATTATNTGEAQGAQAFGQREIQSQYLAQVRKKIRDANQRIMPSDYIRDILPHTVSADFEVVIGRGGQLLSVQLRRPSGYSTLDAKAREAIQSAKPFEGYPPSAGEKISLKVTVYYTPER